MFRTRCSATIEPRVLQEMLRKALEESSREAGLAVDYEDWRLRIFMFLTWQAVGKLTERRPPT